MRIVVIANIQLNPPVVYLLQYSTVTYRVELIKQGKITRQCSSANMKYYINPYHCSIMPALCTNMNLEQRCKLFTKLAAIK